MRLSADLVGWFFVGYTRKSDKKFVDHSVFSVFQLFLAHLKFCMPYHTSS